MKADPLDFLDMPQKTSTKPSEDPLSFLDSPNKKNLSKASKLASQYAIGAAETALFPYEASVAPLASKKAQQVPYREELFKDIERLQEQKSMGQWDKKDQELYDSLVKQAKNPRESEKFVKTADISVGSLAEKAASKLGHDLKPEGFSEHAARIGGNLLSPKNLLKGGKNLASLATKEGRSASKLASQTEALKKIAGNNPEKQGLLKLSKDLDLSPEASSLLIRSNGNAEILGKIAKKTKAYKSTVKELGDKLGKNYETVAVGIFRAEELGEKEDS